METKIKDNQKKGIAPFTTIAKEIARSGADKSRISHLLKLVPKEDYVKRELEEIMVWLQKIAKKDGK